MPSGQLAYIVPVNMPDGGDESPSHPIAGLPTRPAHPIALPPLPPGSPEHPIVPPGVGEPSHPIVLPGAPSHPIFLPAEPSHPIALPPPVAGQPLPTPPATPTHPIATPPPVAGQPLPTPPVLPGHPLPTPPTVWPPLNPGDGVQGSGWLLVLVIGADGQYKAKWILVDTGAPSHPIAPTPGPK
jgi:hypothetical protein